MRPPGADAKEWDRLEARESLIPGAGLGLFATAPIAAGEIVCDYRGTVLRFMQCFKLENRDYVRTLQPLMRVTYGWVRRARGCLLAVMRMRR